MSNKKNIDRLFQEKFKDFEVAPNDAVWDRINESLPNKKKKRRVIALWWQIGGVAAAIALLLTVGVSVFNSGDIDNQNSPVVNTQDKDNDDLNQDKPTELNDKQKELNKSKTDNLKFVDSDKDKDLIKQESDNIPQNGSSSDELTSQVKSQSYSVANTSNEREKTSTSQKQKSLKTFTNKNQTTKVAENTTINNSTLNNSDNKTEVLPKSDIKSEIKKIIKDSKTKVAENTKSNISQSETSDIKENKTSSTEFEKTNLIDDQKKQSIESAIAENTKATDEKEEDDEQNRWSIAPNVAPVYYSSLGQGSSLDQQFNNNSKSSAINMSYGISGAYAFSKKLKIRTGINRVNLNQTTSDVFAFTGSTASRGNAQSVEQSSGNIEFNRTSNVVLMSSEMLNGSSAPELFNAQAAGEVDQRFGFIEVPVELEYRLLDKKFGINVIGGFSTFFLNENEIYADIDGASTLIGEANNINNTSFSANFGLGLDYSLSKQWNINLEPQFKYQINTFNNTSGDFRPFFIGVYTGLSFKF